MDDSHQSNRHDSGDPFTPTEIASFNSKLTVYFFSALGLVATIAVACAVILALTVDRTPANATMAGMNMAGAQSPVTASAVSSPAVLSSVKLKLIPSSKMGPDGKLHDAFTVTNFAVRVGQPVKLTIDNTDNQPHSITSTAAGVNIVAKPGVHTYTLLVAKSGRFLWYCAYPCDSDANGWAMAHPGYMSGYITAT